MAVMEEGARTSKPLLKSASYNKSLASDTWAGRYLPVPDARGAWDDLSNRFFRDTRNSTIYIFRILTGLRYKEGNNLIQHLDIFKSYWL